MSQAAPQLLHVEASPRGARSASIAVAEAFVAAWRDTHPGGAVDVLDVWATELPAFDGDALDAKYAGLEGRDRTAAQAEVWAKIGELAERFRRADVILLSVPMWNFGIPYRLKHLIDAISQKDVLFTFDERGLIGMLTGKRAVVVDARGVALGEHFPREKFDFQGRYMTAWLNMIGVTDITHIEVEKTLMGADAAHASRTQACADAARLGASF